jgi:hypothetical protein
MLVLRTLYQGSVLWPHGGCRQPITQDRVQSVYSVSEVSDDYDKCAAAGLKATYCRDFQFARWLEEEGGEDAGENTTDWEQREYFDFF